MQELIEALKNKNAILFVGSGISATLGIPTWDQLIDHLAHELNYDEDVFRTLGDNLSLAEYYILTKGSIGELRSWLDLNWHDPQIRIQDSEIHHLIVKLKFPIIYTTNYDRWIEKAFDYYNERLIKIKSVGDLCKIKEGAVQLIKLHGDFDDDSSIVLTESSYFSRLDFESPLDIKLRSDILGKTILFIGYSLTDINIRYLLYKLHKTWESSSYSNFRPKSYIFLSKPNPIQEKVLGNRGINTIFSDNDDPELALNSFLKKLLYEAYGIK